MAILPVASIIGRLVGGFILNYVSLKGFSFVMMAMQFLSLVMLALAGGEFVLYFSLALFGLAVGNMLILQPLLTAEAFGMRDYARILALANLMMSFGTAAGPGLLGLVYAAQNAYPMSYALAALASLLGLSCFIAAGRMPKMRSGEESRGESRLQMDSSNSSER